MPAPAVYHLVPSSLRLTVGQALPSFLPFSFTRTARCLLAPHSLHARDARFRSNDSGLELQFIVSSYFLLFLFFLLPEHNGLPS